MKKAPEEFGADAYQKMLERKADAEAALEREFEVVMRLPAEVKRRIMAGWPQAKRNKMKGFYLRNYGVSSGRVLGWFGKERKEDPNKKKVDQIEWEVQSELDRRIWDEDNGGFDFT